MWQALPLMFLNFHSSHSDLELLIIMCTYASISNLESQSNEGEKAALITRTESNGIEKNKQMEVMGIGLEVTRRRQWRMQQGSVFRRGDTRARLAMRIETVSGYKTMIGR